MKNGIIEFEFEFFDTYLCDYAKGQVKISVNYSYNGKKSDEAILNEIKKETQNEFQKMIDNNRDYHSMAIIQGNQPGYSKYLVSNVKTDAEISSFAFYNISYTDDSLLKIKEYKSKDHSNDEKCVVPEKTTRTTQTTNTTGTSTDSNNTPYLIGGIIIAIVLVAIICVVIRKKK